MRRPPPAQKTQPPAEQLSNARNASNASNATTSTISPLQFAFNATPLSAAAQQQLFAGSGGLEGANAAAAYAELADLAQKITKMRSTRDAIERDLNAAIMEKKVINDEGGELFVDVMAAVPTLPRPTTSDAEEARERRVRCAVAREIIVEEALWSRHRAIKHKRRVVTLMTYFFLALLAALNLASEEQMLDGTIERYSLQHVLPFVINLLIPGIILGLMRYGERNKLSRLQQMYADMAEEHREMWVAIQDTMLAADDLDNHETWTAYTRLNKMTITLTRAEKTRAMEKLGGMNAPLRREAVERRQNSHDDAVLGGLDAAQQAMDRTVMGAAGPAMQALDDIVSPKVAKLGPMGKIASAVGWVKPPDTRRLLPR